VCAFQWLPYKFLRNNVGKENIIHIAQRNWLGKVKILIYLGHLRFRKCNWNVLGSYEIHKICDDSLVNKLISFLFGKRLELPITRVLG
jgi:hypothetical protein